MEISSGCRSRIALYTSRNTQHSFSVSFVLFLSFFLFFRFIKKKEMKFSTRQRWADELMSWHPLRKLKRQQPQQNASLFVLLFILFFEADQKKEKKMFLSIFGRRGRRYSLEKRKKNNPIRKRPPLPSIHICTRLWQRKSFVNKSVTLSWETRCGPTRDGNWSTVDTADIHRR